MTPVAVAASVRSDLSDRDGRIDSLTASAYRIPTDRPEADGTYSWNATTLVVVEASAGGQTGLGYTYADSSIVRLVGGVLAEAAKSPHAMDPPAAWLAMAAAVRNLGRDGLAATAISEVDTALWDLKAKILGQPLALLFGRIRHEVAIYGSGGFTTYTDGELREQLSGWVEQNGCRWVKMKIGMQPARDPERVRTAKSAIGDRTLYVDANGAFDVKQAEALARRFATDAQVGWFEEPVSSDDCDGLAFLRAHMPTGMEIAAGEYGYDLDYFRHMLARGAVDVLQADVTRCGGYTGFLKIAALCDAYHVPLSGHCAPALHLPAACAASPLRHLEWFHDHVRIEHMLFDGAPTPRDGYISPDLGRPGHGLVFKRQDAERFRVQ